MHSRELVGTGEKGEEEGNDVQISDFMHSREMGGCERERREGNDVQVGAALIPFLVNTSLLILPDRRRSNHK